VQGAPWPSVSRVGQSLTKWLRTRRLGLLGVVLEGHVSKCMDRAKSYAFDFFRCASTATTELPTP
jgi:hypothetical protein